MNVSVSGLSHTSPDDVGLLLVSPAGQRTLLMTDSGGSRAVSGINLTFDDAASGFLPNGPFLSSGTYKPSVGASSAAASLQGHSRMLPWDRTAHHCRYSTAATPTAPGSSTSSTTRAGIAVPSTGWSLTFMDSTPLRTIGGRASYTTNEGTLFTAVLTNPTASPMTSTADGGGRSRLIWSMTPITARSP